MFPENLVGPTWEEAYGPEFDCILDVVYVHKSKKHALLLLALYTRLAKDSTMEDELDSLFADVSILTAKGPNELEAELNAALLDYYEDLAWWTTCDQTAPAAEQVSVDRLLYRYMDRSTADWCMWKRCLVCNSSNFAATVTSLPPYQTKVTSVEVCTKPNSLGDGDSAIRHPEPAWNDYFVALLPSKYFEKTGDLSVLTVDGSPLAFEVFTRQRQPNDPNGSYFKYEEVICAGKSLFSTTM